MPRYRHMIEVPGYDLPGHLARTRCGRTVAYGRMPNVPRTDPQYCPRCLEFDAPVARGPHAIGEDSRAYEAGPPHRRPGGRVLRLHLTGMLEIAIPEGLEEDGAGWDEWLDAVIRQSLDDGRWLECTSIAESEVGVLDEHGWIR